MDHNGEEYLKRFAAKYKETTTINYYYYKLLLLVRHYH